MQIVDDVITRHIILHCIVCWGEECAQCPYTRRMPRVVKLGGKTLVVVKSVVKFKFFA